MMSHNASYYCTYLASQDITTLSQESTYFCKGGGGVGVEFSPLYTGGLFQSYMLEKSICHFRGVGLFCRFYSILDGKSC